MDFGSHNSVCRLTTDQTTIVRFPTQSRMFLFAITSNWK